MPQRQHLGGIFEYFRSRRMDLFLTTLRPTAATRVLDVGGEPEIWEYCSVRPQVTFLNLPGALVSGRSNLQLAGDGRLLPFRDQSFDLVFSNSVIEHVGALEEQGRFAREAARVGRSYWIQTPNRYFPVELHMMMPFVHFFPKPLQKAVIDRFMVWELFVHPTADQRTWFVRHLLHELNLLDSASLQSLFPEATILSEKFAGFTKSIVAVQA